MAGFLYYEQVNKSAGRLACYNAGGGSRLQCAFRSGIRLAFEVPVKEKLRRSINT